MIRHIAASTAVMALACAGTSRPDPGHLALARSLVHAPPARWAELIPAVRRLGATAAPALIDALDDDDAARAEGRQAAIGTLGLIETQAAAAYLIDELRTGKAGAAEAALGLANHDTPGARRALADALANNAGETEPRTAAACALLRLGDFERATPYLVALFAVATPAADTRVEDFGLPNGRVRWAHEREMAILAIEDVFGERFGLDPDGSWPALATAADRFERAARARVRKE